MNYGKGLFLLASITMASMQGSLSKIDKTIHGGLALSGFALAETAAVVLHNKSKYETCRRALDNKITEESKIVQNILNQQDDPIMALDLLELRYKGLSDTTQVKEKIGEYFITKKFDNLKQQEKDAYFLTISKEIVVLFDPNSLYQEKRQLLLQQEACALAIRYNQYALLSTCIFGLVKLVRWYFPCEWYAFESEGYVIHCEQNS